MITVSNGLSLIRAPLALLFWQDSPMIRFMAILLAMITDSIDGYLARRSQSTSRLGAILDPAMDKFFVYCALTVFFLEDKIQLVAVITMLSRDLFLCLNAALIVIGGRWKSLVFQAIRWGKITTALQFLVLMALNFGIEVPWFIFASFIVMGWLAFLEVLPLTKSRALSNL